MDDLIRRRDFLAAEPQGEHLEFKVEFSHMPLTAILEMNYNRGMVFSSQEGRARFFDIADANPRNVEYWSALSHARATNLGAWGSRDMLYNDCAHIMAYELQKAQLDLGLRPDVTPREVAESRIFSIAYEAARSHKEAAVNNFVRSLGDNWQHMSHLTALPLEREAMEEMKYLHLKVLVELRRISDECALSVIQKSGLGRAQSPYAGSLPERFD
jgi:hypothetical protein